MFERVLPIGTVVLLKEAKKRVMIIGYCKYNGEDRTKIYDYAGCVYPEGYISPETTVLFNHENIDVIFALGFRNQAQHDFQLKLEDALESLHTKAEENGDGSE
jgi:hypothetical protein